MTRFTLCLFTVLAFAGAVAGCGDDFTLLAPESQRNAASFFDDPKDFEIAINGTYDALQLGGTYGGDYWMLMEMRSDNTDQGPDVTGLSAALAAVNEFKELPTSEIVQRAWTDSYKGVARANLILARLNDITMPAALRQQFEGEALFLRSLFFYNLTMAYGNITLILDETTSPNQAINQVPPSEVFAQLKTDLRRAQDLLPPSYPAGQRGRATRWAASTLLAKVLLMTGERQEAATVLRNIVNTSPHRLLDSYAALWNGPSALNDETIFAVHFKQGGIGEGNPLTTTFSPELQVSGAYRNRPTLNMVAAYEPGDARFAVSMDTTFRNNAGQQVPGRWVKKYNSVPFAPNDADNDFIVFRYADVLLMLAEALGEGGESYNFINQVRARAGLAPISAATPGSFEDKLLHERRVELAFENHRWFDLRRFGRENLVVANELQSLGTTQVKTLFPIPQREIDTAPDVMQQNPEYR